jgi:hypothetical protein
MSAGESPIGARGRVTSSGGIRPGMTGAQGISEIIAQVIGQAGPALEMAQATLASRKATYGAKPE